MFKNITELVRYETLRMLWLRKKQKDRFVRHTEHILKCYLYDDRVEKELKIVRIYNGKIFGESHYTRFLDFYI